MLNEKFPRRQKTMTRYAHRLYLLREERGIGTDVICWIQISVPYVLSEMYWWYLYPFQWATREILSYYVVWSCDGCSNCLSDPDTFPLRLLVAFSKQLRYYLADNLTMNLQIFSPRVYMWTITTAHVQDEHWDTEQKNVLSKVMKLVKLEPEFKPVCLIPVPGLFLLHQYSFYS